MVAKVSLVEELKVKAETNVRLKSLVSDMGKIIVKDVVDNGGEVTPSLLNKILAKKTKKKRIVYGDILKEILFWQCCFYLLNDDQSDDMLKVYGYLYRHPQESYERVIGGLADELDPVLIPMTVDLSKPQAESLDDLKTFADAAKISIGVYYKLVEEIIRDSGRGMMPLWVYHSEVIGNETAWKKKLTHWLRCYFAYDLHKGEGMGKTEIGRSLQGLDLYSPMNLEQKDKHNLVHKVDELLNEAERLMLSARNGTFPL